MLAPYLHAMFRLDDGTPTIGFWYVVALGTLMAAAGVWQVVAPESMRTRYFKVLNGIRRDRGRRLVTPANAWGWSSPAQIRLGGVVAIVAGLAAITLVVFFTAPGVTY